MEKVHKISVPMRYGPEKMAKKAAQEFADPGKRLYTDIRKGQQSHNFVQNEREDFKPGTIKAVQGPNGIVIYKGQVKDVVAPKYKKPGA